MTHRHMKYFNPEVMLLEEPLQDFLNTKIKEFNAGNGYKNFNDFLLEDAVETQKNGDGVSYIVWNVQYDKNDIEMKRDIVAYYTIATTSIPYEDRIRLEPEEAEIEGKEYDIHICGIPAIEIKRFAVDEKYQDIFYEYEGEDMPISAWIIRDIIGHAEELLNTVIGFKAIFLHSVPEAEVFYKRNGFHTVKENMKPLHSMDSDFTAMYLTLREVHMNYDD